MSEETRYPEGITPELLMAYDDGALDAGEIARVEAMLAAHPELAGEVAAYRQTAAALAGAFDAPLDEDSEPCSAARSLLVEARAPQIADSLLLASWSQLTPSHKRSSPQHQHKRLILQAAGSMPWPHTM